MYNKMRDSGLALMLFAIGMTLVSIATGEPTKFGAAMAWIFLITGLNLMIFAQDDDKHKD